MVNQGVQSFMDSSQESSLLGSPIDGCQEVQSVGELSLSGSPQSVKKSSLSRSQSPSKSILSRSLVCQKVHSIRKFSLLESPVCRESSLSRSPVCQGVQSPSESCLSGSLLSFKESSLSGSSVRRVARSVWAQSGRESSFSGSPVCQEVHSVRKSSQFLPIVSFYTIKTT